MGKISSGERKNKDAVQTITNTSNWRRISVNSDFTLKVITKKIFQISIKMIAFQSSSGYKNVFGEYSIFTATLKTTTFSCGCDYPVSVFKLAVTRCIILTLIIDSDF